MGKRDYLRVVKIDILFCKFFIVMLLLLCKWATTFAEHPTYEHDSLEISLLTCSPGHTDIYTLYGHTAIRCHNFTTKEDIVFNYGIFNFHQENFILRFAFGKTDYELGVTSMQRFINGYLSEGRGVLEQTLNMTQEEKEAIFLALKINSLKENKIYRYNFFRRNCTTEARDMVERIMGRNLFYHPVKRHETYRQIIHRHTQFRPWAAFVQDLCLGFSADTLLDWRASQFIPSQLFDDIQTATLLRNEDSVPFVKGNHTLIKPQIFPNKKEFPLSPEQCAIVILVFVLFFSILEWRRKKTFRSIDIALMLVQGVAGVLITILFFSEHPTTSTNLQILILNPFSLFFIPKVLKEKGKMWWNMVIIFSILFFIGSFLQDYAEGMYLITLSLLVRACINLYTLRYA